MIVAIVSGKGGVGKSSICTGLGAALAQRGRKVLLVDCDAGLRSLDLMLGVGKELLFDFGDVLCGRCEPQQALYPVPSVSSLTLLPAPAATGTLENAREIKEALETYLPDFDDILLDAPAGIDDSFHALIACAVCTLVVATPDPVCLRDAAAVSALVRASGCDQVRLIVNRLDLELIRDGKLPNLDEAIDSALIQLIGVVPDDLQILLSQVQGRPPLRGRAARAFDRIAARMCGQRVPLPRPKKI